MATSWKSQQGKGHYSLQFETDNEESYKLVEKASQMAVDGKTNSDFEEVVRCKDCKRAKSLIFEGFYKCRRHNACRKANDFCSFGEKDRLFQKR